jgi:anti-sigma factor RsiW
VTCQEVVARLSDYIDGTLAAAVRSSLEEHIAACHGCHVVLDSTQCTILLSRAASTSALTGEKRRQLMRRLEAACRDCTRSEDPAGQSS